MKTSNNPITFTREELHDFLSLMSNQTLVTVSFMQNESEEQEAKKDQTG